MLKVLGVIDLIGGVLIFLVGLAFVISVFAPGKGSPPPIALGVILAVVGLVMIWVGVMMACGGVVVSPSKIATLAVLPHSCAREEVERINIVRSDLGHLERILPIVIRKDGTSMKLTALAWPYTGRFPGSRAAGLTLDYQATLVSEIRSTLGAGGDDYQSV